MHLNVEMIVKIVLKVFLNFNRKILSLMNTKSTYMKMIFQKECDKYIFLLFILEVYLSTNTKKLHYHLLMINDDLKMKLKAYFGIRKWDFRLYVLFVYIFHNHYV